jgi:N-formylglutamate amidohydrolase
VQIIADNCERGFTTHNFDAFAVPVLLSVPHGGRDYPPELIEKLRVPATELIRLEDRYADRLVQQSIADGVPTISANRARGWIDLNRDECDFDSEMIQGTLPGKPPVPSAKTRGGLGLFPRRLTGCGELWKSPITTEDAARRLDEMHRPYHRAIDRQLDAIRARFGIAFLIDIHSMPPLRPQYHWNSVQIVVGDRFGNSAASRYSEFVLSQLRSTGIESALNHPYSGDHILRRHGRPTHNIHAIQIEIDRLLYLDGDMREPMPSLSKITAIIADLVQSLADFSGYALPIAAE